MGRSEVTRLLSEIFEAWVTDPDSDVVAAELVEGRWAVRMAQQTRDFTTVWVTPGDRTVGFEAYFLPPPPAGVEETYRLLLTRNTRTWRSHFCLDLGGEIYIRGRMGIVDLTEEALQYVFAEIYELVDLTFRPVLRTAFRR